MLILEGLEVQQDAFVLRADLSVAPGSRVAIIGASGAGKSTLLAALAGFLPVRGSIRWQGQEISGLSPAERPGAVVFQDNNLFPHLTAFQNVAMGLRASLRLSAAEHQQVEDSLTRVGLVGMGARKPGQLSGGQQSRVTLARMLLQRKPLVLLDEPFAALGPAMRAEMLDLVAALCRANGSTALMVSHDPTDARRFADQVIWVDAGVVHAPVATDALFNAPPPALAAYLGQQS
ncbi:ATP-binding cassette domain-containing protein [Candidatus Halocynthiibacter alkanivorans]|uniref:thiamine ABC transporter ATP-binding protein n=1 Tax=Candidatus Halocynthiibacter alkanivorans TaxID=2267619 RepID=UPI000DF30D0C|nr:ATP-binding cassette domain-containing protein [Candidatus Halocynthiibacter alkanivorans]